MRITSTGLRSILIVALVFLSFFVAEVALAWTGPPAGTPPTCPAGSVGCSAPVNLGSSAQTKTGGLTAGSLTSSGTIQNTAGGLNIKGTVDGNWAAYINWPAVSTYGLIVGSGAGYSQFSNSSGYNVQLANGSWGVYTNGNIYATGVLQSGGPVVSAGIYWSGTMQLDNPYNGTWQMCPTNWFVIGFCVGGAFNDCSGNRSQIKCAY